MYGTIKKIRDLEINKTWFIIAALFFLTISATIFFVSQKRDNNLITNQPPINKVQSQPTSVEKAQEVVQAPEQKKEEPKEILMKWPALGETIKAFGFSHSETFNDVRFHAGIDIALPPGYEVRSVLQGMVASVSSSPLWGYEIVIKHGEKLETRYKGIKPQKEEIGYTVEKGDIIGEVMTSPRYEAKTSPHLHFEVYEFGKAVDPMKYLKNSGQ